MYNPTFSICIPNYNYAEYIGETIESVLNQTYPHFEIIVADNASTDNSLAVIQSYNDPRIKVIVNKYNIGFAPNLQKATMHAGMDFINLLSSDDKMTPQALEEYATLIRENSANKESLVLFSDAGIIDGRSQYKGYITRDLQTMGAIYTQNGNSVAEKELESFGKTLIYQGEEIMKCVLPKLNTFAPFLTIAYSRALWQKIEGYHAIRTVGPDKFFNYKLLSTNPKVIYYRKPIFEYRIHGSENFVAQKKSLKQQIDDYLYTLEFKETYLQRFGLSEDEFKKSFLDKVCFQNGLSDLTRGSYIHAWQVLFFGLAAYPLISLKRKKFYQLLALLLTGPFAKVLAKGLSYLNNRSQYSEI